MAWARVQSKIFGTGGAQSASGTFSSAVSSGSSVLVFVATFYGDQFSGNPYTCTDDKGGTYTQDAYVDGGSGTQSSVMAFRRDNITDAPITITVSAAVNAGFIFNCVAVEYSGLNTTSSYDASVTNATASTPFTVGPVTTANAAELLIGLRSRQNGADTDDYTLDSPWAKVAFGNTAVNISVMVGERNAATATTYSFTGTGFDGALPRGIILAYKPATGATFDPATGFSWPDTNNPLPVRRGVVAYQ